MQWILYSFRPLYREECYFALLTGIESGDLIEWDPKAVTQDDMDRLLLDVSKGLAEMTRAKKPTVQFIHESVREFLLKPGALAGLYPGFQGLSKVKSHRRLTQFCERQIQTSILPEANFEFPPIRPRSNEAEALRTRLQTMFPLVAYAVESVFWHAEQSELAETSQISFLQRVFTEKWCLLHDTFQKFASRRIKGRKSKNDTELIYLLAQQNLASLLKAKLSAFTLSEKSRRRILFKLCKQHNLKACRLFYETSGAYRHSIDAPHNRFALPLLEVACSSGGEWKVLGDQALHDVLEVLSSWHDQPAQPQLNSALACAVRFDHQKAIELLCNKGADVNSRDRAEASPLSRAAANGNEAAVKFLFSRGAEVDSQEKDGWTPLFSAAMIGHEAIVAFLLSVGAAVDSENSPGRTPLFLGAKGGHGAIVALLCSRGATISRQDRAGGTPLSVAAHYGHEAIVAFLCSQGAIIDAGNSRGQTPLSLAAGSRHEAVVALLCKHGALVDSMSSEGRTPLSYAAGSGHEAVVALLCKHGALVDSMSSEGRTPLSYAAGSGHEAVVAFLHSRSANIDNRSSSGRTPLSFAIGSGRQTTAALLCSLGADVNVPDQRGRTALHYIIIEWADGAVAYLMDPKLGSEMVSLLAHNGANLDYTDASGISALHLAILKHYDVGAKALYDHGAEMTLPTNGLKGTDRERDELSGKLRKLRMSNRVYPCCKRTTEQENANFKSISTRRKTSEMPVYS